MGARVAGPIQCGRVCRRSAQFAGCGGYGAMAGPELGALERLLEGRGEVRQGRASTISANGKPPVDQDEGVGLHQVTGVIVVDAPERLRGRTLIVTRALGLTG